jgi:hypothetical protein
MVLESCCNKPRWQSFASVKTGLNLLQSLSDPESDNLKSSLSKWEGMDRCAREGFGKGNDSFAVVGFPMLLRSLGIWVSSKSESESDSLESELESLPLSLELSDNTPTVAAT